MPTIVTDQSIITDLLERRINEAIPSKEELQKRLLSGRRLRIYQGFDPTSPNLHIGHLVGILTLKAFQDLGHEVIFLIGDFTATIGDPTGKDKTRVPLTAEKVQENAQTYQNQIKSVLKFDGDNPAQLRFNSEWLRLMQMEEVLKLAMGFTAQQMLERDMFQKRLAEGKPISLHEFLYPVLVTKDALALDVDIELGGSDQLFNMSVGRHVIKSLSRKDKMAITTNLLTDSSGRKIGKTEGNAVNISDTPENLFGQIMSLPDDAIMPCFRLITLVPTEQLTQIKEEVQKEPLKQKKHLAWEVVKMLHSEEVANDAQQHFEKTVQAGELPEDIPTFEAGKLSQNPLEVTEMLVEVGLTQSKSEARRLVEQGAVRVNGDTITDRKAKVTLSPETVIQAGKRSLIKFV